MDLNTVKPRRQGELRGSHKVLLNSNNFLLSQSVGNFEVHRGESGPGVLGVADRDGRGGDGERAGDIRVGVTPLVPY